MVLCHRILKKKVQELALPEHLDTHTLALENPGVDFQVSYVLATWVVRIARKFLVSGGVTNTVDPLRGSLVGSFPRRACRLADFFLLDFTRSVTGCLGGRLTDASKKRKFVGGFDVALVYCCMCVAWC